MHHPLGTKKISPYCAIVVWLAALEGPAATAADAACNVIPPAERTFPSTLGEVTTPFAAPGQTVTVRREAPVFSANPGGNIVTLHFQPVGGTETTIADILTRGPVDGSECTPLDCTPAGCRCVRFVFPDTDSNVG